MNKLILAAAAIAAFGFVTTSTAEAGGIPCPRWECGTNGTQLNGITLPQLVASRQPAVNAVILPSGETADLR